MPSPGERPRSPHQAAAEVHGLHLHADGHAGTECCPFQEAIDLLSKRHAMTIIWALQQREPRRFNELKRTLQVNPVSLSQRLDELESAGVVRRITFNETPPRVEYSLTQKGKDLLPLMDQMSAWAKRYQQADAQAVSKAT
jgi:DNA-binding HxlR family transcriptional regulator